MSNLEITLPVSRRISEIRQQIEDKYKSNSDSLRFQIRSLEAKVPRDKSAYDAKEENLDHTDEDSDNDNDEEADGKKEAITPNIKSPAYAPYSPRIDIRTHKVSTE
jgi:Arc/MetJ-type ribon-helix-helix transcriptional regulator